jgi:hypothetical protein
VDRYVVAVALAAAAAAVARWLSRRTRANASPVAPTYDAPSGVDRDDFDRPEVPALIVVFASATCLSCADAIARARELDSETVTVAVVEASERRDLHRKYAIEAVPIVVVADAAGTVTASFVGVPPRTDLATAVADVTNDQRTGSTGPT